MRELAPAAATVGLAALLWILWEGLRVLFLRGFFVGIAGGPVLNLQGDLHSSWWLELALPVLFCAVLSIGAGALGKLRPPTSVGFGLLGLGAASLLGWTLLTLIAGISGTLDTWIEAPVFFQLPDNLSYWSPWARWWSDLGMLGAAAALMVAGPHTASARRATFGILLATLADSIWRALVALTSGQVPLLSTGPGVWESLADVIWIGVGAFLVLFVFVFANLPDRDGPRRPIALGLLALCGVWTGLQGALLFTAGSLTAMGLDGRLSFPLPLYESQLAALRLGLLLATAAAVALGLWRDQAR